MKYLTNAEFIETLRAMADFYEEHPAVPVPGDFKFGWMRVYLPTDEAKEVLSSIGSFRKDFEPEYENFVAIKQIGHIDFHFVTKREAVCVRKVVGTRLVPEEVVPSSYQEERIVPAHEEEIVEWDCKPVLG